MNYHGSRINNEVNYKSNGNSFLEMHHLKIALKCELLGTVQKYPVITLIDSVKKIGVICCLDSG